MDLYIDIANKKLVQSSTSNKSVSSPTFMQGDNEPLIIHLLEKATDGSLYQEKKLSLETDTLKVAIGRFNEEPRILTFVDTYALKNDLAEIILPLNTSQIEQALEGKSYISAYLEVEISNTNATVQTILQTSCKVRNDLIEGAASIDIKPTFEKYLEETIEAKNEAIEASENAKSSKMNVYLKENNTYTKLDEQVYFRIIKLTNGKYTFEIKPIEE